MSKTKVDSLVPGGVDEYIAGHPAEVRGKLSEMRALIQAAAPGAIETVSYFDIPGYSYPGYDYNGMFAWFSLQKSAVRLHVRPPVLENHKDDLKGLAATKAIVSFPLAKELPKQLIANLVKASLDEMKGREAPQGSYL